LQQQQQQLQQKQQQLQQKQNAWFHLVALFSKWGIVAEKNPNGQKWVLYARHIFRFYPREMYKHVVKVAN